LNFRTPQFFTFPGMYIKSIGRNRYRVTPNILYPFLYVHISSVINEVLQMICIPIFPTFTKKNNRFADKYPPLGFSSILVYQFMALPQCFYLFCYDTEAIFCTNGI